MANTYTQLYVQIIFSTKNRERLLHKSMREQLFAYISGIINNKGQFSLAVNGYLDHVHIFLSMKPDTAVSDLVKSIKQSSTNFIKEKGLIKNRFAWQKGYGAFTYSRSQIDDVVNYIVNQEEHHKHKTFEDEYISFLEKFGIDFDRRYVFD